MLANSILLIAIFIGLSLSAYGDQGASSHGSERQLIETLFTNYSKNQRPSSTVNISLNLVVANVNSVDPKKEQIGLRIWLRMIWMDHRLEWNSSQYNITSLTVNFDDVWTPDMTLYSAVGDVRDFGISSHDGLDISVIIYNDGLVFFSQPTTIQSACAMNIADFPFDDQVCRVTFGSWTMDFTLVRLHLWKGGVDLEQLVKNNLWDLLYVSSEAKNELYFSHKNPVSIVIFTMAVRRKALFYVVNYIAPAVAISLLSLLLFLIPPEVGKRMEAGINLLLCLSVYLLMVNSKMPSTSTAFPLVTKFYGCAIIILVLAMCCTCLVYALYFMNSSGLQIHDAAMALKLKKFILQRLRPLLFRCPCSRPLKTKPGGRRSIVHPTETDFNLNEFKNEGQDKGTVESQGNDEQDPTSSREPAFIITSSTRKSIPRISAVSCEDQEGHLTLAEVSSVDLSSSISTIASLNSNEDSNILATVYFTHPAENIVNTGVTEERKKVTFAYPKNGGVKRRSTSIKGDRSAVKKTEHTLISTTESTWFSLSWEESQENGNEEIAKQTEDVSGQLNEEASISRVQKDSNSDDQAPELFDQLVLSFDAENTKSTNTQQWQRAAMVLDRMFIIFLFTSILVSFLSCLLLAPRVRHSFIL